MNSDERVYDLVPIAFDIWHHTRRCAFERKANMVMGSMTLLAHCSRAWRY